MILINENLSFLSSMYIFYLYFVFVVISYVYLNVFFYVFGLVPY